MSTTRAPSAANARASASPCPRAAPLITTTLPSKRSVMPAPQPEEVDGRDAVADLREETFFFRKSSLPGCGDLVDASARQHDPAVRVGHDHVAGRDRHAGHGDRDAHVARVCLTVRRTEIQRLHAGKPFREPVDVADAAVDDEADDAAHCAATARISPQ